MIQRIMGTGGDGGRSGVQALWSVVVSPATKTLLPLPHGAGGARQGTAGSTLIEVLFIVFWLVVVLAALLFSMTFGLTNLREHQRELLAKTALIRRMELLHHQAFNAIASGPFTEGLELLPGATGTVSVCTYNPTTQACVSGFGLPTLKRVTVTVSLSADRMWRSVTLVSR